MAVCTRSHTPLRRRLFQASMCAMKSDVTGQRITRDPLQLRAGRRQLRASASPAATDIHCAQANSCGSGKAGRVETEGQVSHEATCRLVRCVVRRCRAPVRNASRDVTEHTSSGCTLSAEAPRRLVLSRETDREHLARDLASIVGIARRYMAATPSDDQQHRRFLDCEAALIEQIATRHGVAPDQLRAQSAAIGSRGVAQHDAQEGEGKP
jgi:hypothetical protein